MDKQTQVLDSVLRKYAKSDKELFSSLENVSEDAFKEELKQLNLSDYTKRDSFYWELQVVVEKCVSEHGGSDDNERLAEIIVETWNQTKEIKITQSLALSFMYLINLKFPNTRKAFIGVCDGDLRSYKAFNSKPRLFIELLVRFLICVNEKQQNNTLFKAVEQVMSMLFEDTSKSDYSESFGRLGYLNKKGLKYGKMNAYRKHIGVESLVYAEGMKTILLEVLDDVGESDILATLKHGLTSVVEIEEQNNTEDEFQVDDLMEEHIPEVNAPSSFEPKQDEETTNKSLESELLTESAEESVQNTTEYEETKTPTSEQVIVGGLGETDVQQERNLHEKEPDNEIVSALKNALEAVQTAIVQASQLPKQSVPTQETSQTEVNQGKLKIAEEEIDRLKIALQQEKEKVALAEEKAYAKVLNAIGGESSNYLLSDLFEESQGQAPSNPNISAGRLINLFSSLSLAIGLDEHSNSYELGDVFSVHKDELIKNYRIDGPVLSQNEVITVKLLKYGWTINGKVVVQPLVIEVKEEKLNG